MISNKRSIPEIRERLLQIAEEKNIPELADLAEETRRRPAIRRAPKKSDPLTKEKAEEIRVYAKNNPHASQQEIGNKFKMNPGRVSDSLLKKV